MAVEFRGIHEAFLADTTAQICLEGARYSGKTWACSAKVIQSCLDHPGIHWLICRYSNEETKTKVRPVFEQMCLRMGVTVEWHNDEEAFWFPPVAGKISKAFAYGLKAQTKTLELAKVRGLEMGGIWNDQSEEMPQAITEELPFGTRQQGYPHQVLYSPNPPSEDHYLTDMFPEECAPSNPDRPFAHRAYYCVSLYDNKHNLAPGKIEELEAAYPSTHPKHKSLILGLRGPNVVGVPVYDHAFVRKDHIAPMQFDASAPVLEAIFEGQHHPTWLALQRDYFGGLRILAGIMGKRLFLDDFLPIVQKHRSEWFKGADFQTCCVPPPGGAGAEDSRFTNIALLKDYGFAPVFHPYANAPDVREATIQGIASLMKRRHGTSQGFLVNADPHRFLMASVIVIKQSKFLLDGLEAAYVWDEHFVSVAQKKVRQPKTDEWIDGAQRCLENIVLNFCASQMSDAEREDRAAKAMERDARHRGGVSYSEHGWLGY